MALKTTPYDPAEYLDTPGRIAAYLRVVFEDGDPGTKAAEAAGMKWVRIDKI